jgi:hypothetical protein
VSSLHVRRTASSTHLIREDADVAEYIAVHGTSEYSNGIGKYLLHGNEAQFFLFDAERAALQRSYEFRAQSEGVTTAGGFAVPTFLDPSVILTNLRAGAGILCCRHPMQRDGKWSSVC